MATAPRPLLSSLTHQDYRRALRGPRPTAGQMSRHASVARPMRRIASIPPQIRTPSPAPYKGPEFLRNTPHFGHPSLAVSFIPIVGSGMEALADFQDGDYAGGALNTTLAVSDLIPAKAVTGLALKAGMIGVRAGLKAGGKKLIKTALERSFKAAIKTGSHTWNATRKWAGRAGHAEFGQHMHHWLIPQNGWGKHVPDWFKNQLWNLKPMQDEIMHGRIHNAYEGLRRFNPIERFMHGTPAWWKATLFSNGGHAVSATRGHR